MFVWEQRLSVSRSRCCGLPSKIGCGVFPNYPELGFASSSTLLSLFRYLLNHVNRLLFSSTAIVEVILRLTVQPSIAAPNTHIPQNMRSRPPRTSSFLARGCDVITRFVSWMLQSALYCRNDLHICLFVRKE